MPGCFLFFLPPLSVTCLYCFLSTSQCVSPLYLCVTQLSQIIQLNYSIWCHGENRYWFWLLSCHQYFRRVHVASPLWKKKRKKEKQSGPCPKQAGLPSMQHWKKLYKTAPFFTFVLRRPWIIEWQAWLDTVRRHNRGLSLFSSQACQIKWLRETAALSGSAF